MMELIKMRIMERKGRSQNFEKKFHNMNKVSASRCKGKETILKKILVDNLKSGNK